MRLLFKLRPVKNCEYDLKYFHKLQGFIYNLLKETEYGILHDVKKSKKLEKAHVFQLLYLYLLS